MKTTLKYLSEEELNNPDRVFTDFFEFLHLHEAKAMLDQLKQAAFEQFTAKEFYQEDVEYFFERLEKLIEACWLVR